MRCTLFLDGKPVPGQISYFSGDASFLNRWRAATSRNPKARDSTYFANCALKQWEAFHAAENYARSIDEIDTYIIDNPNVEVSNFVLLTMGSLTVNPTRAIPTLNLQQAMLPDFVIFGEHGATTLSWILSRHTRKLQMDQRCRP